MMYFSLIAASLAASLAVDTPHIASLHIEPAQVVLSDADQSVQFLVTCKMSDGTLHDATRQAEFTASLPGIATIEHGRLTPKEARRSKCRICCAGIVFVGKARTSQLLGNNWRASNAADGRKTKQIMRQLFLRAS